MIIILKNIVLMWKKPMNIIKTIFRSNSYSTGEVIFQENTEKQSIFCNNIVVIRMQLTVTEPVN